MCAGGLLKINLEGEGHLREVRNENYFSSAIAERYSGLLLCIH